MLHLQHLQTHQKDTGWPENQLMLIRSVKQWLSAESENLLITVHVQPSEPDFSAVQYSIKDTVISGQVTARDSVSLQWEEVIRCGQSAVVRLWVIKRSLYDHLWLH